MGYRALLGIGTEPSPESSLRVFCVCVWGLDITPLIESVSSFNLGGLSPPKIPVERDGIGIGSI